MTELNHLTATEAARQITAGTITSEQLVRACLAELQHAKARSAPGCIAIQTRRLRRRWAVDRGGAGACSPAYRLR